MPLVEQELLTFPEYPSSPPVFSGVRVTRSLVLCVCFVNRCLSFCTFSFSHCVVCSSSIYGLCLPLWYLQTLLNNILWNFRMLLKWFLFKMSRYNSNWKKNSCHVIFIRLRISVYVRVSYSNMSSTHDKAETFLEVI